MTSEKQMNRQDDDEDLLEHAAVGETRTVTEKTRLHGINFEPDVFYGSDRMGEAKIVDVKVIEDEREGYADDLEVTWEAEMTKRLPRRWDYHDDPVTEKEKRVANRRKWLGRLGRVAGLVIPVAVATWVGTAVMNQLAENLVINGETLSPPGTGFMVVLMLVLLALVMAADYILPGGTRGAR